jgi:serine protease Do
MLKPMRHVTAITVVAAAMLTPLAPAQDGKPDTRALRRTPVVEVFERSRQAVVNISSTQIIEYRTAPGLEGLFEQLFDLPPARPRVQQFKAVSVGSGFVVHRDGYIVTNAHVVARTAERKVTFGDGQSFDAATVAIDVERDLAVLKIDAGRPLAPLPLGRSSDLMVGETVIAIGNPLGYQHTVTAGVVSALGRRLEVTEEVVFEDLIQTDASINPGNSGGPLLNVLGELVGVNTAIRADAQNIGFAIPVDQLRAVIPQLLDVERRYRIRTGLTLSPDDRRLVVGIEQGSPAEQAGLKLGDVIVALDGVPLGSGLDLHIGLIGHKPGEKLKLRIRRGDVEQDVVMELASRPRPAGEKLLKDLLGLEAQAITPELARQSGMPQLRGLVVTGVDWGSPAARGGIRRGDVIDHIGTQQITSLDDAGEVLESARSGSRIPIGILRIGERTVLRTTISLKTR